MGLFKKEPDVSVKVMECVRCGAKAIVEGSLSESAEGGSITFTIKNASFWKSIFGVGTRKVLAYACMHCSHVELMVEFTDKDRKNYQEFDGPQPGVIERIDGDK